jgi:hypothetical protein
MTVRCPNEPKGFSEGILNNAEKQAKIYINPANKNADIIIDNTKPIQELQKVLGELVTKAKEGMSI